MAGVETRNINRDSLFLLADLTFEGHTETQRVKVRNLSTGGLMGESDLQIEAGARLSVELRNIGKIDGTVAWVQGRRFGVAFEQEVDPKLARSQVGGQNGESNVPRFARAVLEQTPAEKQRTNIRPL